MTKISFHNQLGQIVTYPIVAEFTDTDGRRFFVFGPVPQGPYDTTPPYNVREYGNGEWRHN